MDINVAKEQFMKRFGKVTDDGEATEIVAIKLDWDIKNHTVALSQSYRTREILSDYNMSDCTPISTPMDTITISSADCPQIGSFEWFEMQNIPYRECVGRLANLSRNTRPDISNAVLQVERYMHNPGFAHWKAVKRILRYLANDPDKALVLAPFVDATPRIYEQTSSTTIQGQLKFYGLTDADWGGDKETAKSTSGYCFFLGGALISWSSKTQTTTATSTTYAEYIALYLKHSGLVNF
jgi:hypothetical protein